MPGGGLVVMTSPDGTGGVAVESSLPPSTTVNPSAVSVSRAEVIDWPTTPFVGIVTFWVPREP